MVVNKRSYALDAFRGFANNLDSLRSRRTRSLPAESPARRFRSPLISCITSNLDYDGKNIVFVLANGMPTSGPITPTPGLSTRKREAQMSYQQWKREIPKRNKDVIERVTKSQGAELSIKRWGGTLTEVNAGWMTEPIELTELAKTTTPLTPRYAIKEQHGEQLPEIRPIGDFRPSTINAIIETDDTNIPDSLDAFIAISSYFKILAPSFQLMCATMDFDHRGGSKLFFRTIPKFFAYNNT